MLRIHEPQVEDHLAFFKRRYDDTQLEDLLFVMQGVIPDAHILDCLPVGPSCLGPESYYQRKNAADFVIRLLFPGSIIYGLFFAFLVGYFALTAVSVFSPAAVG